MRSVPARVALHLLAGLVATAAAVSPLRSQAEKRPELYCIRDVRLAAPADSPRHTLILRDGRIESVLEAAAEPPPGARVVEGQGRLALPAFLDAYTQAGCATPTPVAERDAPPSASAEALVDMRESNRKGIQPSFRAADAFQLDLEARKKLRSSGFGALLSAPAGQFLAGESALASTRDGPPRDVLLAATRFDHAGFQAPGPGYPGTLMGAIAQIRQFFLDAQRQGAIAARRAAGRPGPRPPHDADLEAIRPALAGERRIVCEAESAGDIERWIALADEFHLQIAISGGREAWKRAAVLRERGIPVFLTLDWGEEVEDPHAKDKEKKVPEAAPEAAPEPPKEGKETGAGSSPKAPDWKYEDPLRVREERRRLWVENRDGALRLAEAGVPFAFGSGKGSPKDLLEHVRKLVEAGLAADAALAALTSTSADLLGVGAEYGKIEPGRAASIALWTKDPMTSKDAKVAWLVADGFPYEMEVDTAPALEGPPADGIDATGTWHLEFETPPGRTATLELKMEKEGDVRGALRSKGPNDDSERSGDFEGHVAGTKIRLTGALKTGNFEVEIVLDGELEKDEMTGSTTWKLPRREEIRKFKATRAPKDGGDDR